MQMPPVNDVKGFQETGNDYGDLRGDTLKAFLPKNYVNINLPSLLEGRIVRADDEREYVRVQFLPKKIREQSV